MATLYFGQDQHAIDSKGRINIPARHRRIAAERGCSEFWFSPGFGPYALLWDARGFETYSERLMQLPAGNQKAMALKRSIYSNSVLVEPDGQGRVVIPELLRAHAELSSHALVLGVQDRIELWNPDAYQAYVTEEKTALGDLAALANDLPF